jgi:hypothetical protein
VSLAQLVRTEIARLERAVEELEASTPSLRAQRLAVELLSYLAERPTPPS